MKILLVEDDNDKATDVSRTLLKAGVPDESCIDTTTNAADALRALERVAYDLLILDLAIPKSKADDVDASGGQNLLRRLLADAKYLRPDHIVGLTSYNEAYEASVGVFNNGLWSIARFDRGSSDWIDKISNRVQHLLAKTAAQQQGVDFDYDLAIVCALVNPELHAVLELDGNWSEHSESLDPTRYWKGVFRSNTNGDKKVIACNAPHMGMAPSAAIAAKVCMRFKPKRLIMTGICAGREGDINLGDIVVASPSWDYGSGKFTTKGKGTEFEPSPVQMQLSPLLRRAAEEIASDRPFLDGVRNNFVGEKPDTVLNVAVAPMASGAAVRADDGFFDQLAAQHRKIVAIDMEAFGVFSAAFEMPEPKPEVMVVKSVSDFANSEKNDRYRKYAAYTSAHFAREVLRRLDAAN